MADVKISALPASTTPLAGTEVLPIVQSSTTRQVSVANLTAGRAVNALSITASSLTSGRVTYAGTAGLLQDSANLTFDGTILTAGSIKDTALTSGRVTYAGASGLLSDSANLVWDNTNARLGIGTASPSYILDIQKTASAQLRLFSTNNSTGSQLILGSGTGTGTTSQYVYFDNSLVFSSAGVADRMSITAAGTFTTVLDASINSLTVGRGGGAVASNTAVGASALTANIGGANNTAVGYQALAANTSGASNNAIGWQAGSSTLSGNYNTFIGQQSGNVITTGSSNIYVGYQAQASGAAVTNEIVIGSAATGKGSTTGFIAPSTGGVYQGNNSTLWSVTSDARLKKNIVDNNTGLDKITAIQVRNFEYRLPEEITEVPQDQAIKKEGIQLGVIAQELQQILPECVKTESTGVMSVDADNLTWYLINAVKELNAKIAQLEAKLGA